jgi:hypothetical protein
MKYTFLLIIFLVNKLEMTRAYYEDENTFESNLNDSRLDENTGNAEIFINSDSNSFGRESDRGDEYMLRQNEKRGDDNENDTIVGIDLNSESEKKNLEHKNNSVPLINLEIFVKEISDLIDAYKKLSSDIKGLVEKVKAKQNEKQNDKNAPIDKIDNEIRDLKVELESKKLERETNLMTMKEYIFMGIDEMEKVSFKSTFKNIFKDTFKKLLKTFLDNSNKQKLN